jgi:hypothetical protein
MIEVTLNELCEPRDASMEHSDKEKFRSDLNSPESCAMSERLSKTLGKSGDFQAEYEGSIALIRRNIFAPHCERRISFRQARRLLMVYFGSARSNHLCCRPSVPVSFRLLSRIAI